MMMTTWTKWVTKPVAVLSAANGTATHWWTDNLDSDAIRAGAA